MFFNLHCCGLRGCEPGQTVFSSNFSVATEICHCTFSACSVIYLLSHGLQFYFFFHLPCHFRSMQCKLFNQPCPLDDIFYYIYHFCKFCMVDTPDLFIGACVCLFFTYSVFALVKSIGVFAGNRRPSFPDFKW
jgi:hypothetical protein